MRAITSAWLLASSLAGLANCAPTNSSGDYEYIVIGSGAGGGTLAANLARAGHSVLLLEAGGDGGESVLQRVPAASANAAEAPDMSWSFFVSHYKNETQARRDSKFTYTFSNGSLWYGLDPPDGAEPLGILYPRGATVGGSSQVNAMNFALPPDADWDHVANLTGDPSWAATNMRKYFIALENSTYAPAGTPGHGFAGPFESNQNNISLVTNMPGVVSILSSAARELEGIEDADSSRVTELMQRDMNRIEPRRYTEQGIYQMPAHIDALRRRAGARDYVIETLSARKEDGSQMYPLTLRTHALATRVLFREGGGCSGGSGAKPRAYGVEYMAGEGLYGADKRFNASQTGQLFNVTASREVVVAGGAFNTPQILKLSGVGPRGELEALGIPVVADVPAVGRHLQDNYEGGVVVHASAAWENRPLENCTFTLDAVDPCFAEWNATGTGPYGEGAAPMGLWFRSSVSENEDSDLFFFGMAALTFRGFYPGYSTDLGPPTSFAWSMVKMQTGNAAGEVTLRSRDPRDVPEIAFNYFAEGGDRDLAALTEGYDLAMRIFAGTGAPYAPYTVVEPPPASGSVRQGIMNEAFGHHATSSCRMGPAGHADYCVGPDFRVNGVRGLRVVDASVFPRTPGAFPVGPIFMLAYKAAETMLKDL